MYVIKFLIKYQELLSMDGRIIKFSKKHTLVYSRYMLVVFEGISGVGKTTQIRRLRKYLIKKLGVEVVIFSSEKSEVIIDLRKLAKSFPVNSFKRESIFWIIREIKEILVRNLLEKIKPNSIVLVDRLWGSAIAYALKFFDFRPDFWEKFVAISLRPDLTFLLDIDCKKANMRKFSHTIKKPRDCSLLKENYLSLAKKFRWKIVKADGELDKITKLLASEILRKYKKTTASKP